MAAQPCCSRLSRMHSMEVLSKRHAVCLYAEALAKRGGPAVQAKIVMVMSGDTQQQHLGHRGLADQLLTQQGMHASDNSKKSSGPGMILLRYLCLFASVCLCLHLCTTLLLGALLGRLAGYVSSKCGAKLCLQVAQTLSTRATRDARA